MAETDQRERGMTPTESVQKYLKHVRLTGTFERWNFQSAVKEGSNGQGEAVIFIRFVARPPYGSPTCKEVISDGEVPLAMVQTLLGCDALDELAYRLGELVHVLIRQAVNYALGEELVIAGKRWWSAEERERMAKLAEKPAVLGPNGMPVC